MTLKQILLGAPLSSSSLIINREAMGTTEPVTTWDSIKKKNPNDSLGGMAEQTRNLFHLSDVNKAEKSQFSPAKHENGFDIFFH